MLFLKTATCTIRNIIGWENTLPLEYLCTSPRISHVDSSFKSTFNLLSYFHFLFHPRTFTSFCPVCALNKLFKKKSKTVDTWQAANSLFFLSFLSGANRSITCSNPHHTQSRGGGRFNLPRRAKTWFLLTLDRVGSEIGLLLDVNNDDDCSYFFAPQMRMDTPRTNHSQKRTRLGPKCRILNESRSDCLFGTFLNTFFRPK